MKNHYYLVLKFQKNAGIELSAGKIIRYGVLLAGYICHPVIAVYVVYAEEVETIYPQHHTDICTAIGGGTETVGLQLSVGCCKRKTIGKGEFQRHAPLLAAREIIGEEEVYRITLVGRQRDALATQFHLGIHERKTEPGIGTRNKFSVEFEVESCRMTAAFVLSVINYLHVTNRIRNQITQSLVIGFGREFIALVSYLEPIVVAGDEVDASLALNSLKNGA